MSISNLIKELWDAFMFVMTNPNDSERPTTPQNTWTATSSNPQATPLTTQNSANGGHISRIPDWANAIRQWEGAAPTLNNPGNLKYSTLTASWGGRKGHQASDGGWLCQFPTYEAGFTALCNFLTLGAENELKAFHKARTFQAFTKVFAGNPPQGYINGIASILEIPLDTDVSKLL